MTYRCKHCSFKWDAWEGDIQKVLDHEKAHLKDKATVTTMQHIAGKTV